MSNKEMTLNHFKLNPVGMGSHATQEHITNAAANIVMHYGRYTLAEMGYLNMVSVVYTKNKIDVRLYFDLYLATKHTDAPNFVGKRNSHVVPGRIINPALNVFQNHFFVGNIMDVVTVEEMNVPNYIIKKNSRNKKAVKVKGNTEELKKVLVLHCNPDLVFASMMNIDLRDPNYKLSYRTISDGIMLYGNEGDEYPVEIEVQSTMNLNGYRPEDAIPYLLKVAKMGRKEQKKQELLKEEISDKADDLEKKRMKKKKDDFGKFI